MSIEAKMSIEEATNILKNCNSGELYFSTDERYEKISKAIETVLQELDKKDKIIDLMADAIYGEFYSFELNSGKKVKKHFEDLAKEK